MLMLLLILMLILMRRCQYSVPPKAAGCGGSYILHCHPFVLLFFGGFPCIGLVFACLGLRLPRLIRTNTRLRCRNVLPVILDSVCVLFELGVVGRKFDSGICVVLSFVKPLEVLAMDH